MKKNEDTVTENLKTAPDQAQTDHHNDQMALSEKKKKAFIKKHSCFQMKRRS